MKPREQNKYGRLDFKLFCCFVVVVVFYCFFDHDLDHDQNNDNDNEQSQRLETIETLLTFLTIENNNLNIHSEPSIKSDRGQHWQFLRCFKNRKFGKSESQNVPLFSEGQLKRKCIFIQDVTDVNGGNVFVQFGLNTTR